MLSDFQWHIRKNIQLAVPVVVAQLGQIMVGVADTVMVGQVGKVPLAAVSLANSIFSVIMVFGIGLSYAVTPLTAKADGEKNKPAIKDLLKHSILLNGVAGIIMGGMVYLVAYLIIYFNQPEAVVQEAVPYLHVIAFSLFPLMVFQGGRQFSEGLSETKLPMMVIIGVNLLNIVLNYIFIFGKLGFPTMGLLGAGVATLISRMIMAIVMLRLMFSHIKYREYVAGFVFRYFSRYRIKQLLSLGLPMGIQFTFEVTAFSFSAIMIGWMGTVPLAAHQIAINMAAITYMAATGIASAATIRVSNQMGRKDIKTMKQAAYSCLFLVIVFMLTNAIIFILFRDYLPMIYNDDEQVVSLAASLLVIAAIFQLSDGIQAVGLGMLRGLADVKVPTVITLVAYWGFALPGGYFLGFVLNLGAAGIWYGLLSGLSVAAILLLFRFHRLSHRI